MYLPIQYPHGDPRLSSAKKLLRVHEAAVWANYTLRTEWNFDSPGVAEQTLSVGSFWANPHRPARWVQPHSGSNLMSVRHADEQNGNYIFQVWKAF